MDADVIVVGTRAAGAASALLLARAGLQVVAVDRAHFPSDTLSSHQLQPPGAAALRRWGLLDRLLATGVPPTRRITFDAGPAILAGPIGAYDGVEAMYSPRRTVLDALLVDAAREAGAEVIEGFDVAGLLVEDGRVSGIRGRPRSSTTGPAQEQSLTARLVVGADGKHSRVADAVSARCYLQAPAQAAACYAYWQGLELDGGEIYGRERRLVGAWPTHDGLVVTFVGMPLADFEDYRADPEGHLFASLDQAGTLGQRARSANRVEQIRATSDLPHRFRTATGPGWALAGDAGLVMDPCTGQGIGHALLDAEALASAVTAGLAGTQPIEPALAAYAQQRDEARRPMHQLTADLASFAPQAGGDELFRGLAASAEGTRQFFAVLGGVESPAAFFRPGNLRRLLGWRATLSMLRRGRPAGVRLT